MRRLLLVVLALAIPTTLPSVPVHACSVQWKKGDSPAEVRRSSKIKKVRGTYKLENVEGRRGVDEDGNEIIYEAQFLGTLTSESGKKWQTIHDLPPETGITCADARYAEFWKPKGDAKGVFWIEIRKKRGRHRLRDWEGEHLPVPANGDTKD